MRARLALTILTLLASAPALAQSRPSLSVERAPYD